MTTATGDVITATINIGSTIYTATGTFGPGAYTFGIANFMDGGTSLMIGDLVDGDSYTVNVSSSMTSDTVSYTHLTLPTILLV